MSPWLRVLKSVGLEALKLSPLGPIAAPVIDLIAEAQALHPVAADATPEERAAANAKKLALVLEGATDAARIAQAAGKPVSPELVNDAGAHAIAAALDVTKIVQQAHGDHLAATAAPAQ